VGRYTVLLYHDEEEGGYAALIPVLGVATQGESIDEALAMAKEAAELQIRGLIEDGEPVLMEETPPIVAAIEVAVPVEADV
jgi:predicted RNase H-like HicB family nuclease